MSRLRSATLFATLSLSVVACLAGDDTLDELDDTALAADESELGIGVGNACFNQWSTPQIVANEYFYPTALNADGTAPVGWYPPSGRYQRGGVLYHSGYQFNLRLLTDGCTHIKSVALGSTQLPKDTWHGEFYRTYLSPTQPLELDRLSHDVFVHVLPQFNGRTDTLTITVGRDKGTLTATYTIPLVRVARIEARNADAAISISESEIHNLFARALHDAFDYTGANSIPGSGGRIYGYDPALTSVNVRTDDIGFHFEFRADLPLCDPKVKVDGRIRVRADADGIAVFLPNNPQVTPMWPNDVCVVAAAFIDDLVWELSQRVASEIAQTMREQINDNLPDVGPASSFLQGTVYKPDNLEVLVRLPVPSIAFSPAYDPSLTLSMRFPAGERIGLLASGLGAREYHTSPNNHWRITGPNGLPKTGTPDAIWAATHSFARTATVWGDQPVGRLIARTLVGSLIVTHAYTPGCKITVDSGSPSIRFGANDTPGGVFQASRPYVRALFLDANPPFADGATPCASFETFGGEVFE